MEDFCLPHKEMAGIESERKTQRSKTDEQFCMQRYGCLRLMHTAKILVI